MAVHRVVAPNPGPYTGPGTNSWIVEAGPVVVVIDPGPDDESHLAALNARIGGATIGVVLVTHSHPDHLPLAERLATAHHASVQRFPGLGDEEVVRVGTLNVTALHTPGHSADHLCFWLADDRALLTRGLILRRGRSLAVYPEGDVTALHTPGHSADHLCFWLADDRALFTGDLILGRGSSMVTYPEGDVAAYLRSLEKVAALRPRLLFPGHWDPVEDAMAKIDEYRTHRLEREAQVLGEVRRGKGTAAELTRRVYGGLDEQLLVAAEMTMRAHLRKLVDDGAVRSSGGGDREIFDAPVS